VQRNIVLSLLVKISAEANVVPRSGNLYPRLFLSESSTHVILLRGCVSSAIPSLVQKQRAKMSREASLLQQARYISSKRSTQRQNRQDCFYDGDEVAVFYGMIIGALQNRCTVFYSQLRNRKASYLQHSCVKLHGDEFWEFFVLWWGWEEREKERERRESIARARF